MTATATQANLLHELTEGPYQTMLLLADLALDAGDTDLASGWRWLAKHRRRPWLSGRSWWQWSTAVDQANLDQYQDWLPRAMIEAMNSDGKSFCRYATEEEAFLAAARAVGQWLRQGGDHAE